ncbi:glutathione S-transferase family protein [Rhodovulum euryhalinum]|uniref:Glutathione S-transferase n=1 Tax=Rhodovulum euryhalinum TaxID=35805 RepID=A0A4R2KFX5_9RHOB|nr:glutathione S-transferase family protein [Rhodovulum euryhalinum]TCO71282.1 glutathione S-transferase [Rhodovulum euryhalinum]
MLALHVFAPEMGMISPSPFSVKALLLLELSGMPFTRVPGDPRKAPRGKLPVLVDNGQAIPDSEAIRAHLARAHGFDADAHLTTRQRAEAAAIRALVEEHLYWVLVHSRWIERPAETRAAFFGRLPAPLRRPVFALVRRQVDRALQGQGTGRHAPGEIHAMGAEGLAALATLLGDGPYLFGDRPSSIDTVIFGFLENVLAATLDTPLRAAAAAHPGLVAYHRRLRTGIAAPLLP